VIDARLPRYQVVIGDVLESIAQACRKRTYILYALGKVDIETGLSAYLEHRLREKAQV
jgi:hypothetical protein